MSGKKINIGLGDLADVIIAIVPDTKPKTFGGKITRLLKQAAKLLKFGKTTKDIIEK